jgi:serine protease AprX
LIGKYRQEQKFSPLVKKMQLIRDQNICMRLMIESYSRNMDKVISTIESHQGKVLRELHIMPLFVVELPLAGLEALAGSGYINKIWDDVPIHIVLDRSFSETNRSATQDLGYTGKGVVIAILDTGIYPHDDLITPFNRILAWNDLINQKNTPYDDNGHGTHVTGVIAGNGINTDGRYKGIAPEARLVGIKVLNQDGIGVVSDVISGIEWCLDHQSTLNTRIINLSFRTIIQESPDADPLCRAAAIAWKKGVIVCKASGDTWPCFTSIKNAKPIWREILVGNLNEQQPLTNEDLSRDYIKEKRMAPNSLVMPELVASGTEITSLGNDGGYNTLNGTSIATAFVSGAAALILQKWPNMNPDQVKYLLLKRSSDLGLGVNLQGAGVLDLGRIFNQGQRKNSPLGGNSKPSLDNSLMQSIFTMVSQNPNLQQKVNQFIINALMSLLKNLH